ncbi:MULTISPECIES: winged helix-turn-helix domain-containing protein, partial [Streptomyces]
GPFRLDRDRRLLLCGEAPVALSSRAFDILELLVAHRDRVVTREEILAHVWPGLVVEASNLTVQVSTLRRALGDTGGEARYIATIPGRGYRFIGQPEAGPERPGQAAAAAPDPSVGEAPAAETAAPVAAVAAPARA